MISMGIPQVTGIIHLKQEINMLKTCYFPVNQCRIPVSRFDKFTRIQQGKQVNDRVHNLSFTC